MLDDQSAWCGNCMLTYCTQSCLNSPTCHGLQHVLGDGYITDPALQQTDNLDDPRPFFANVLNRTYADRVVLAPHFHAESASGNRLSGAELYNRLGKSWGQLAKQGFCVLNKCRRFPVIAGQTCCGPLSF